MLSSKSGKVLHEQHVISVNNIDQ